MNSPVIPRASAMLAAAMLAIVPAGVASANQGLPAGIVVYTVSTFPVSVPRGLTTITKVIHLDRVLAIEEQLAESLDQVPEHRRNAIAESRLSPALQLELKNTWEALFRIRQDRITHLPAIVFDDQAVWYGSDFRRAVTRYRNLKNAEGGS